MAKHLPDADSSLGDYVGDQGETTNLYQKVAAKGDAFIVTHALERPGPNVIYLMTDDERDDFVRGKQLLLRPKLKQWIIDKGTMFRHWRGSFNLCAPTRSTVFTGQYWWTHGLFNESAINTFNWSSQIFHDCWEQSGERFVQTIFDGKVVNGWGKSTGLLPVPPNMMANSFDDFNGFIDNEQSKANWLMHRETFQVDGTSNGYTEYQAHYTQGGIVGDYQTDKMTVWALQQLSDCVNRPVDDPRHGLPFFLYLTPTVGHTPFQRPPIPDPPNDTENRLGQCAAWNAYFPPMYDGRTGGGVVSLTSNATAVSATSLSTGLTWTANQWFGYVLNYNGAAAYITSNTTNQLRFSDGWFDPATLVPGSIWEPVATPALGGTFTLSTPISNGITGTTGTVTATTVEVPGSTWDTDEWLHFIVTIGSAFGVVLGNDADTLTIGEWLVTDSGLSSTTQSWTLASTPASSSTYTLTGALPDIVQQHFLVQGTGGAYTSNSGANVKDDPNVGQEFVGIESMIDQICTFLDAQPGQYNLDNTVFIYTSDNGSNRGQKSYGVRTVTTTSGSATVTDSTCTAADQGESIFGTGIPANTFVGTVTGGVSFKLSSSATSQVDVNATTTGSHAVTVTESVMYNDKGYPPDSNFRVPFIVRWTGGGIPQGVVNNFHGHSCDINPTIRSFLGVTSPRVVDGIDLAPYLRGFSDWADIADRAFVFNGNAVGTTKGVVTKNWRYYQDSQPARGISSPMLFNWVRDPLELRNLYGAGGTDPDTGESIAAVQSALVALVTAHYNTGENGSVLVDLAYP